MKISSSFCRATGAIAALVWLDASSAIHAQPAPDTENGRYSMSAIDGGFLRLDTRTGTVSNCSNKGGWTCRSVPDERSALDAEIGRLQGENQKLKDQLAQRDAAAGKTDAPLAKGDSQKKTAESALPDKTIELQLPAEHQKIVAMFDRVWQRLVEMASRLQKKLSEKI